MGRNAAAKVAFGWRTAQAAPVKDPAIQDAPENNSLGRNLSAAGALNFTTGWSAPSPQPLTHPARDPGPVWCRGLPLWTVWTMAIPPGARAESAD
jgi:hypothetical protein